MTYILFDWYKHSEPDFEDRKMAHRPHTRVCVPCQDHFPRGGNGRELRKKLEAHVAPGDVCANMQLFTGDYLPRGYVTLR